MGNLKEQLPPSGKNEDIAVDVAAMTTDGGTIIYGVAENKAIGTFTAAPIPLPGAMERISNVVKGSIAGSPSFDVYPLDPGQPTGFLVVSVPASMNAPHLRRRPVLRIDWRHCVEQAHRGYGQHP
jgi:hypothetical protein